MGCQVYNHLNKCIVRVPVCQSFTMFVWVKPINITILRNFYTLFQSNYICIWAKDTSVVLLAQKTECQEYFKTNHYQQYQRIEPCGTPVLTNKWRTYFFLLVRYDQKTFIFLPLEFSVIFSIDKELKMKYWPRNFFLVEGVWST